MMFKLNVLVTFLDVVIEADDEDAAREAIHDLTPFELIEKAERGTSNYEIDEA